MADKKIAEIHLEMYDTEKGVCFKAKSNGKGIHTMILIADYIVSVSQEQGFDYTFMLNTISELCKDLKKECEKC